MSRLLLVLAGLAAVGWLAVGLLAGDDPKGLPLKLVTHKVQRERLEPMLVERGTVESADKTDMVCQVKARTSNATVATAIKRVLVEDGEQVKKGQLLLDLDAAGLEEQLKTQRIACELAELRQADAKEQLSVVTSQNASELGTAKFNIRLAEVDLEKYLKGDLEQMLHDVKARILLAEADAEQLKDALEQAESNRKDSQVRAARLRLEAAQLGLKKSQLELHTLEKYSKPRTEMDLNGRLTLARQELERVQQVTRAKEAQARQDVEAKKSVYQHEQARYQEIEEEIKLCKVYAPGTAWCSMTVLTELSSAGNRRWPRASRYVRARG
jgi:multidrug efflux pump subunit AcrA (membrane-fusion protein)